MGLGDSSGWTPPGTATRAQPRRRLPGDPADPGQPSRLLPDGRTEAPLSFTACLGLSPCCMTSPRPVPRPSSPPTHPWSPPSPARASRNWAI